MILFDYIISFPATVFLSCEVPTHFECTSPHTQACVSRGNEILSSLNFTHHHHSRPVTHLVYWQHTAHPSYSSIYHKKLRSGKSNLGDQFTVSLLLFHDTVWLLKHNHIANADLTTYYKQDDDWIQNWVEGNEVWAVQESKIILHVVIFDR